MGIFREKITLKHIGKRAVEIYNHKLSFDPSELKFMTELDIFVVDFMITNSIDDYDKNDPYAVWLKCEIEQCKDIDKNRVLLFGSINTAISASNQEVELTIFDDMSYAQIIFVTYEEALEQLGEEAYFSLPA